jgi:hypothetical protein
MQPVLQGAQGIGAGVLLGCLAGRAAIRSKIGIGIGIGVFGMRVQYSPLNTFRGFNIRHTLMLHSRHASPHF